MKLRAALIGLLLCAVPALADSLCRTYPADAGKAIGPVICQRCGAGGFGVFIAKTSGSSTVGQYKTQVTGSDRDTVFTDLATVSSEGYTNGATTYPGGSPNIRVIMTQAPGSATTVKVCVVLP